ncbi:hypothetical protein GTY87_16635 [Streptomyces sp. SID7813]|uniref:Uncharacterized protein n=1 Tax=Streptomyces coelicolor (strain ATCC BAA-471 / A3(2) / M145) TaxID=100226 RepID=Q9X8D9_STRCO|nr:hypothetical protein [Streptomyces sp. SID7813]QFI43330.1 hypothetical protein FQ762_16775 [Streptomyces coelicolor A3(2)]CAB40324.1 hypothetical protein [Streptomyces coelicolor A3(2)]
MPRRRQPHIADPASVPYRSTACRIGTHHVCADASPTPVPADIPVICEACDCPCHSGVGLSASLEVTQ